MIIIMEEREVKGHPVIEITLEKENAQRIGPVLLVQINLGMIYFWISIYHDSIWLDNQHNVFWHICILLYFQKYHLYSLSNYSSDGNYSNKSSLNDSGVVGDQELDNVSVSNRDLQRYQVGVVCILKNILTLFLFLIRNPVTQNRVLHSYREH